MFDTRSSLASLFKSPARSEIPDADLYDAWWAGENSPLRDVGEDVVSLTDTNNVKVARPLKYIPLLQLSGKEATKTSLQATTAVLANSPKQLANKCNGRRRTCGILMLMLMFLLSATGTVIMWATDVFENIVMKTMVLSNVSSTWEWWVAPPVHPILSVYIFNYTNFDCISSVDNSTYCSRLKVKQIGPYVYRERNEKVDIKFNDDSTISFHEKKIYEFIRERSVGDPRKDQVFVPNIPYLSAIDKIGQMAFINRILMTTALESTNEKPIIKVNPHDLLWGYKDPLFQLAKMMDSIPFEQFGLMVSKANVSVNEVTVHTGANNISRLGAIVRYNGESNVTHWGSDDCNQIEGSDGTVFPPPLVHPGAHLTVYNRDLCRRLPFDYVSEGETQGLPSYRFQMPDNVFDNPDSNPENACYCKKMNDYYYYDEEKDCLPSGVSDSSPCSFGAPILMSFPHFYLGDPILREPLDGLEEPEAEKHESYVDIHQKLGLLLGGHSRLQVNVQVRKGDLGQIRKLKNLRDKSILPVAWFDMTLGEYPSDVMWFLYHGTYTVLIVQKVLMYGCLAGAIASAAALCRRLLLKQPRGLILASASTGSFDSDI